MIMGMQKVERNKPSLTEKFQLIDMERIKEITKCLLNTTAKNDYWGYFGDLLFTDYEKDEIQCYLLEGKPVRNHFNEVTIDDKWIGSESSMKHWKGCLTALIFCLPHCKSYL